MNIFDVELITADEAPASCTNGRAVFYKGVRVGIVAKYLAGHGRGWRYRTEDGAIGDKRTRFAAVKACVLAYLARPAR